MGRPAAGAAGSELCNRSMKGATGGPRRTGEVLGTVAPLQSRIELKLDRRHGSWLARPCTRRQGGADGGPGPKLRQGVALPGSEHLAREGRLVRCLA